MIHRNLFLLMLTLMLSMYLFPSEADNSLLQDLDKCIAQRADYSKNKEKSIEAIRHRIAGASPEERLVLYEKMYQEYYTYRFDSAMSYMQRQHELALKLGNRHYQLLSVIHRALLLATSGYYSQAERSLKDISQNELEPSLKYEYNITAYWIYNYWSDYCQDTTFSPQYDREKQYYLDIAVKCHPHKNSAEYYYLVAEYLYWQKAPVAKSSAYYQKALELTTLNTRTYASAAYALARNYKKEGNMKKYEDWLIRAAMSDQVCPLKENLALQELAMYLFRQDENNAQKASKYIYCSMEDAQFYNNRLRMLEISKRLPVIVSVYEKQLQQKQRSITFGSYLLVFLALVLIVVIVFVWKQNSKLNRRGQEIDQNNRELASLNERLRKTNATREKYMRLFMDLCAIYIGKMNNYRKLVVRKIKAKQVEDLLHHSNSEKLTENEAAEFFLRFDKAFLELFPTFIEEFNALLKDDEKIKLSREGELTTELRIYALMRLGVTDSVEIATLLFYSPQTIYNYRTATKKKVLDKENFEDNLSKLCKLT